MSKVSVKRQKIDYIRATQQAGDDLGLKLVEEGSDIVASFAPRDTGALIGSRGTQRLGKSTWAYYVDKIYARIQEYGGVITPKRARLLSWVDKGGIRRFAKRVTIPPKPYMRTSARALQRKIKQMGKQIFQLAYKRAKRV